MAAPPAHSRRGYEKETRREKISNSGPRRAWARFTPRDLVNPTRWKGIGTLKRSRIVAVTLGALAVSGGVTSSALAQSGSLVGAGSTLVAPLMAKWSQDFQSKNNIGVTYGAVGS